MVTMQMRTQHPLDKQYVDTIKTDQIMLSPQTDNRRIRDTCDGTALVAEMRTEALYH